MCAAKVSDTHWRVKTSKLDGYVYLDGDYVFAGGTEPILKLMIRIPTSCSSVE